MASIGHLANHREIEFPFVENHLRLCLAPRLQHHQHALLAFGQHHLIRRHALFAARDGVHVQPDSNLAIGRHFDAAAGQASRAHILNCYNRIGRHQLKARLDQQFFGERIADLHRRAFCLGIFGKIRRCHGCAMDAVAARFATDIHDGVANARCSGIENLILIGDPHGHRVDQDIAVIGRMEIHFAAHCGNANAIAISADARNHTLHQMLHLGMVRTAKTQRIQVCHRARAHGEHIAQYTAHACCCALIGFNIAWVIVRFHLENRGQFGSVRPFTNINHARIFTGAADHLRSSSGQLAQMNARRFIAAMLRPHDREYAKFDHIRLAPHGGQYPRIFFFIQAVVGDDLWGDI